ncbi:MAG: hypothetical protein WC768_05290 [Patescibacteria group bacterium]|jgi:putative protease
MDQEKTAKKTEPQGKPIGKITHYFNKIGVAVLVLTSDLKVGDTIVIATAQGDFSQPVDSMQVEHSQVISAKAGDSVGLKVSQPVKVGDLAYLKD